MEEKQEVKTSFVLDKDEWLYYGIEHGFVVVSTETRFNPYDGRYPYGTKGFEVKRG